MNQRDIDRIEQIVEDRKRSHTFLVKKRSKTYEAFLDMEKAAYSAGSLERGYKELIAIGISIVIDCESCLEWHIKQALITGATEDQVMEAIEVGMEMGGGPATVTSRFALKVLEYYTTRKEKQKA